jgi:hypothetical protein
LKRLTALGKAGGFSRRLNDFFGRSKRINGLFFFFSTLNLSIFCYEKP